MTLVAWKWGGSHKDLTIPPASPLATDASEALDAELKARNKP